MPPENTFYNRREFVKKSILAGSLLMRGGYHFNETKSVALIGDSIRTGYQEIVEGFLEETAVIWGPEDDNINTIDILENIREWITTDHFDVIHINSGLNDLRTIDYPGQDHMIPSDLYGRNVESILKIINKYSPQTIIVWATITPVVDDMFNEFFKSNQEYQMKNADVIQYNEKAKNIVSRMGSAINDLYGYIMTSDPGFIMLNDGVHYTNYGYELIGERTSDIIKKILNNI